ncbi:MAG: hypothetical protein RL307_760, partial [Pseudomonadota bacterium]
MRKYFSAGLLFALGAINPSAQAQV